MPRLPLLRALLLLGAAWTCLHLQTQMQMQVQAARIDTTSFGPPFEKVDSEGNRLINDTWTHGGDAVVNKHFIRLTTDRQSKRGYVWQREPIGRDAFSLILKFRISGVGKRWFGDGLGIWVTQHAQYVGGPNHGFADTFKGVGVVVDTFNNPELKGGHKDVSVLVNDGAKTMDQLNDEARVGCDAVVRFWEESAAFDPVHSMARLKVKLDGRRVAVEVDADSSGHWTVCYETTLPFGADWLRTATLGITASTGALADNHDLIRLDAFTDYDDVDHANTDTATIMHSVSKEFKKWIDSPNCGTECLVAVLQKEMANFRMKAEHRFTDLKEKTDNIVLKLKKQEKDNERRVAELEEKVSQSIDSTVMGVNQFLDKNAKEQVEAKIAAQAPHGWKMPFFLLALVLGGVVFFVYRKYQAMLKAHLL